MNDNESILAELRRIGAWADMQRRITKWSLIAVAVLVPALIVFGIVMENRLSASMEEVHSPEKAAKPSWNDVDWNIRRADPDEAIRIGEELIQKMPQHPEGHLRLASAYLAAGRADKARDHYAEAFRLLPTEENGKLLAAIDRRIKAGNPQPDGAANRSQPVRSETNSTPSAAGFRR
jgi:cytochrome c-type biogenesis protein CcmH/NrfG